MCFDNTRFFHFDTPNTIVKLKFDKERMAAVARVDILKGTEIFVNYGPKYWFYRKLWHNLSENARQQLMKLE